MPLKRFSRHSTFFVLTLIWLVVTAILWRLTARSLAQSDLRIYLNAGIIDSSYQTGLTITSPYNDLATPLSSGQLLYMVQFDGPIQTGWRTSLVGNGVELSGYYIPNYSYLVRMTPEQTQTVQGLSHVYAVLPFNPAYKPAPDLTLEGDGTTELHVTLFSAADIPQLEQDVQNWGGEVVEVVWASERFALVHINLLDDALKNLVETSYVVYVETYQPPMPLMADTQWVNQGYIRSATPIWDRGLSGTGEIISVHELDCPTCDPPYPYEFEDRSCFFDLANNKVTFYGPTPEPCAYDPPPNPTASTGCYHRTGVLAAAVGDAPPYLSPNSEITYDALAYGSQAIMASSLSNQFDFMNNTIQQGSRLANFSWGSDVGNGQYTASAAAFDDFMWAKMLLNEHMLPFIPAGNKGSSIPPVPNGLVSPGTAKNVVTVGGTERYLIGFPEHSPEDMAAISGWGPTADGRIKPDVTAAGWKVRVPLLITPDGSGCETAAEYQGVNGTSFASPIAASAGALIRDYYRNGYYPGGIVDPSAALVKATLINSGRDMFGELTGGHIPGDKQGWGRITLDDALHFADEPGTLQAIDNLVGLATGQQINYMVQVPDDNNTWELKITLVWTDWVGTPMANPALVNDLDLTVTGPSGVYLGNVFTGGYSSTSGGTPDRRNVVEQVYLSELIGNLDPGSYTITVAGYNVPSGIDPDDTQPYALFINLRPHLPYEQYLPLVFNAGGTEANGAMATATPSPTPLGGYPAPPPTETQSVPYP
jgi:hypothetical protein